jgi:hypothetical protein
MNRLDVVSKDTDENLKQSNIKFNFLYIKSGSLYKFETEKGCGFRYFGAEIIKQWLKQSTNINTLQMIYVL